MNYPKAKIRVLKDNVDVLTYARKVANESDGEKAFMVCDIGEIVRRYNEIITVMPRITPYFAVKCNDHDIVLKTLAALGASFDCSSKLEIDNVLRLNVHPDRIIFAHTTKLIPYIQHAAKVYVSLMNFDNEQELYKIKKYYPDAKLLLRFRCDDETALTNLGKKFGCDHKTEAPHLLNTARKLKLNVVGTCFHVGSCSFYPPIYYTAICYAKEVFLIAKQYGYDMSVLDVGGGIPGYGTTNVKEYAKYINSGINEHFQDPNIKIMSEPGSLLVFTSGYLVTNIHSMRTIKQNDDSLHNMYYINDGYFGSFASFVIHKSEYTAEPLFESKDKMLIDSSIWGPTCDSKDKIGEVKLPQMKIGDWILFRDMGGYTFRTSSEFNGFPRAELHFVVKESIWKVLRDKDQFDADDFIYENDTFELQS